MSSSDQLQSVRFLERVGYGAGDLASCLYYNTFVLFLLLFYTDTFGISAAAAGTMILVYRRRRRSSHGNVGRPYEVAFRQVSSLAAVDGFTLLRLRSADISNP